MKEKVIVLRERNEWEGETWYFYMRHTDALEKILRQAIASATAYGIEVKNLDLAQVKKLPDTTDYMDTHNIVGDVDVERLKKVDLAKDDVFYKGGIQDFMAAQPSPEVSNGAPKRKTKKPASPKGF